MGVNSARHVREAAAILDVPELFAGTRVVRIRVMSTRADDLGLTRDLDDERRRLRLIAFAAGRLPSDLAGGGVESDDELSVEAVATDDQEILKEGGGAPGAVLRFVLEGLLPPDLTLAGDAGRAIEAEVNEDVIAGYDGRG